jgi:hypothetical protein
MIFERGHFNSEKIEKSSVNESYRSIKLFSASSSYDSLPTVFLSHKHSDLEDLQGVMGLLKKLGAKVYIDSMDTKMPKETSGETAERIKEVIKYCKKFVLLATEDAIESFWCNWELGIGDTHRFKKHIAILPIKETGEYDYNYKGNEYLQIYPQIKYYNSFTNIKGHYFESGYYISNPFDNYITELEEWLKQ